MQRREERECMRHNYMKDLKKALYGKNRFVAFLDCFRLNMLYKYVFDNCCGDEASRILDEVLFIEQRSYYEYSDSAERPKFRDVLKNSLMFVFPKADLVINMFSYLSLETAYIRAKMNKCFILSRYKLMYMNKYMETMAYRKAYKRDIKTRDIVSNAILNFAYSAGETDAKSSDLYAKLFAENSSVILK